MSKCIIVVLASFFIYQLFLLVNSFSAINRIYTIIAADLNFWNLLWFSSEASGEIGLIIRFAGACLLIAFSWTLLRKKTFSFSFFRKAVLLEGTYYLFYVPFIINLLIRPASDPTTLRVYYETAISYTIQTVLVSGSFIVLYFKMRNQETYNPQILRWCAIAAVSFVFSLWIKHFMFNLYALPIDLANPILVIGLLNSTLTILAAATILLATLTPVIRTQSAAINKKIIGLAFVLIGAYFVIYILVASVNSSYLAFLQLTELWAISFVVAGAGLLSKRC
jgi:hypothetical protein